MVTPTCNLGVDVPEWFPAPVMNNQPIGVGMNIFLWIFLTPFIMIGLGLLIFFVACLIGSTEVRLNSSKGVVRTAIGPFRYSRRFDSRSVRDVRINETVKDSE